MGTPPNSPTGWRFANPRSSQGGTGCLPTRVQPVVNAARLDEQAVPPTPYSFGVRMGRVPSGSALSPASGGRRFSRAGPTSPTPNAPHPELTASSRSALRAEIVHPAPHRETGTRRVCASDASTSRAPARPAYHGCLIRWMIGRPERIRLASLRPAEAGGDNGPEQRIELPQSTPSRTESTRRGLLDRRNSFRSLCVRRVSLCALWRVRVPLLRG